MKTIMITATAILTMGMAQAEDQQFGLECQLRDAGSGRYAFNFYSIDLPQNRWCRVENGVCRDEAKPVEGIDVTDIRLAPGVVLTRPIGGRPYRMQDAELRGEGDCRERRFTRIPRATS
jgi:hypothetical protein